MQAQQFQWVKSWYPGLFSQIKHFVKKGQFIPVGGTWVEMVKLLSGINPTCIIMWLSSAACCHSTLFYSRLLIRMEICPQVSPWSDSSWRASAFLTRSLGSTVKRCGGFIKHPEFTFCFIPDLNIRLSSLYSSVLATGHIWLLRPASSNYAGIWHFQLFDTEAELEPGQHFSCKYCRHHTLKFKERKSSYFPFWFDLPQHNTFFWEGLDGSKVLTHFPPGNSYEMKGKIEDVSQFFWQP